MPDHEFAVWAPRPERVRLDVDGTLHPMTRSDDGWWRAVVDARRRRPVRLRPRRRRQGAARPPLARASPTACTTARSCGTRRAATWTDADWPGRSIEGAVIYELHVGTFTADRHVRLGDRQARLPGRSRRRLRRAHAGQRLQRHARLGLRRRALVRGARTLRRPRRTGPAGRRLPRPRARRADRRGVQPPRPVGQLPAAVRPVPVRGQQSRGVESINIADADSDEVRAYIIDCALRWMRDFHADGLRLDAVHALVDTTAVHILEELSAETDALAAAIGPPAVPDRRERPATIRGSSPRATAAGYGMTAQWDDDIHHAIHTAVSGERQGYYADFGSLAALANTLKHGYFHAGTYSSFRHRRHGRPLDTATIPATRLLAYTLTHDQVGNRAIGDRPSQNLDFGQLAVKAALALGSPYTAMLFMGEEWGSSSPFQFFSSPPRAGAGAGHRRGTQGRVRRARLGRRRGPRPAGPADLRAVEAELGRGRRRRARAAARRLPRADRAAARRARPRRPVAGPPAASTTTRSSAGSCCTAGHSPSRAISAREPVTVPVAGEVVLAWEQPTVGEATVLPGHSFAILRAVKSPSTAGACG